MSHRYFPKAVLKAVDASDPRMPSANAYRVGKSSSQSEMESMKRQADGSLRMVVAAGLEIGYHPRVDLVFFK